MGELTLAGGRRRRRALLALGAAILVVGALLSLAELADGASDPADSLIYMPYGLIHTVHPVEEVDSYLAEIAHYGIGQFVFAMPKFKAGGVLKLAGDDDRLQRQDRYTWERPEP